MYDRARYEIEVGDDFIEIYGTLTIEEAFDFLNFFEKKGFKSLINGINGNNSCLRMRKESIEEEKEKFLRIEREDDEKFYEKIYQNSEIESDKLRKDISALENLIKDLLLDAKNEREKLVEQIDKLQIEKAENNLKNNPTSAFCADFNYHESKRPI